jgi:hypothetical protein
MDSRDSSQRNGANKKKRVMMKKWIKIILGSLLSLVVIVIVWEWIYLKSTTTKEVFILPEGFKGVVLIAYEQQDGIDNTREDGGLMYRIPRSGVLKMKRQSAATLTQSRYYFENRQEKRTEFYYCFDPNVMKRNKNKIFAFGGSTREFENNGEKVKLTIFFIGTEKDRDSLSKIDEKMNPIEILKRN